MKLNHVYTGHNLEILKSYPDNSIDSVVTDSPYGLSKEPNPTALIQAWIDHGYLEQTGKGFMNKAWDAFVPQPIFWKEVFRVLKPGGYCLSFFGTRTYDWGVLAMRLAGFEVRDSILWIYGSGFPKSLDISKAIDDKLGWERKIKGQYQHPDGGKRKYEKHNTSKGEIPYGHNKGKKRDITEPSTPEAIKWNGWGTNLKPAVEPIVVCRKPISESTIADNVLKWGTGGINIDATRIGIEERTYKGSGKQKQKLSNHEKGDTGIGYMDGNGKDIEFTVNGRFPSNIILNEESAKILDQQSGILKSGKMDQNITGKTGNIYGKQYDRRVTGIGDTGYASRFFYIAKPSQYERNLGCENIEAKTHGHNLTDRCKKCGGRIHQNPDLPSACKCEEPEREHLSAKGNSHPTVKPVRLMQHLVKLVTPKGGTILDPFLGSGTTAIAAKIEGFNFIGIEQDEHSVLIANARIKNWKKYIFLDSKDRPDPVPENQTDLFTETE
jgi:site-specific DNA-methyltransferase (adenine-specific)